MIPLIEPDWPAPARVRALATTRAGGVSRGAFESLNLGAATADDTAAVRENRRRLRAALPSDPGWLRQVHGTCVVRREEVGDKPPEADAAWTASGGLPCTVLTADCLPVLFCDRAGTRVAATHAGWRGLLGGVLEATVAALDIEPDQLMAWLGPAIGPDAYEVGPELRERFVGARPDTAAAFRRRNGRLCADLYAIARIQLEAAGVPAVFGGGYCTYTERGRFFSHRRDGPTGRMAATVWLE